MEASKEIAVVGPLMRDVFRGLKLSIKPVNIKKVIIMLKHISIYILIRISSRSVATRTRASVSSPSLPSGDGGDGCEGPNYS